jgi:hypothetical protein
MCSYVFQEGPWRDTVIKIGYDPRQDPQAFKYAFQFEIYIGETAHSFQDIRSLPCAMSEIPRSVLLSCKRVGHNQGRKETCTCE